MERKAAQGAAPAFNYWFTWQTPVLVTADKCPTMIFDTECVMKNNPDGAERESLRQA
jgi:hypothetical protein